MVYYTDMLGPTYPAEPRVFSFLVPGRQTYHQVGLTRYLYTTTSYFASYKPRWLSRAQYLNSSVISASERFSSAVFSHTNSNTVAQVKLGLAGQGPRLLSFSVHLCMFTKEVTLTPILTASLFICRSTFTHQNVTAILCITNWFLTGILSGVFFCCVYIICETVLFLLLWIVFWTVLKLLLKFMIL